MNEQLKQLVMYSKPGCHLCEGLQEKLESIQKADPCPLPFTLEIRDITTRTEWFDAYQYEIPVLFWAKPQADSEAVISEATISKAPAPDDSEPGSTPSAGLANALIPIARPSPRASVAHVLKLLKSSWLAL